MMYIMAHRGASGYAPENTMAAFRKGIESGADCLELDVRFTKDRVPVICHDAHIGRVSNGGKQFVSDLTYDELTEYDFGSWFSDAFAGEKIALFEDVLKEAAKSEINLNIELKYGPDIPEGLEKTVLDLVYTYHMEKRSMYSSFDHISLQRLYQLDNTAKIGLIFHMNLVNLFDYIKNCEMDVFSIHPNYFYITDDMVKQAHEQGMKINVYTLDDPSYVDKYKDMGVDGLITNKLLDYK